MHGRISGAEYGLRHSLCLWYKFLETVAFTLNLYATATGQAGVIELPVDKGVQGFDRSGGKPQVPEKDGRLEVRGNGRPGLPRSGSTPKPRVRSTLGYEPQPFPSHREAVPQFVAPLRGAISCAERGPRVR